MVRTLNSVGEQQLIRIISAYCNQDSPSLVLGIGDDAAVLRQPRGFLLLASDLLIEGVHFTLDSVPAKWIGWKALAVNISDVAAMGGEPVAAVVSLGAPGDLPLRTVRGFYSGLRACAERFGVSLVGGDCVRAPQCVLNVAITGTLKGSPFKRSGARIGDAVYVTGRLGGALRSGRHARFEPRLEVSRWLRKNATVHAMIDLSDGLGMGAQSLAEAAAVCIDVDPSAVPRHRGADEAQAWFDGEDFELLFTLPPRSARLLPPKIGACALTCIGRVVAGRPGVLRAGKPAVMRPVYEHYK